MASSQVVHYFKDILTGILDVLLPKRTSTLALEKITVEEWQKMAKPRESEGIFFIFPYQDPRVRQTIWEIKYRRNKTLREGLCAATSDILLEELSEKLSLENFSEPIIASIPQSRKRKAERGWNQSEDIAKVIAARLNLSYQRLLYKTKETAGQTTLRRTERLKNMKGAFAPANAPETKGRNIILLDDVTTTGATLNEARKTLREAGARKVWCVALAH